MTIMIPVEGDAESEWQFETAEAGILEEICEAGYFDDGRPEDEVAYLLDDWDFDKLTKEHRQLYEERIYPLMRVWFFERDRFDEEYARRRAEWVHNFHADDRQLDLFAG
ncbi:hypothetical protein [Neoaquamicrobium sediminum]|uniref:Uncharacterized protein n=1 Tax=Neoaquamicrobium sediminum TaxID=1849104 RepID=A0ABV3WYT3_9HYPH